ncbi:MAG: ribonuclease P protein component [Elusimicrobiota bacterium]
MPDFSLGRRSRLSGRQNFQRVFLKGRRVSAHRLLLWHYEQERPRAIGPRMGISISAKVGGAVIRNRLKRLVRETFRVRKNALNPRSDMVVCVRPGCRWKNLPAAEKDLSDLWRKAGVVSC